MRKEYATEWEVHGPLQTFFFSNHLLLTSSPLKVLTHHTWYFFSATPCFTLTPTNCPQNNHSSLTTEELTHEEWGICDHVGLWLLQCAKDGQTQWAIWHQLCSLNPSGMSPATDQHRQLFNSVRVSRSGMKNSCTVALKHIFLPKIFCKKYICTKTNSFKHHILRVINK